MLVDERGAAAAVRSAKKQVSLLRPELCRSDLEKIRDLWDGPLYVKGILDPDDAATAVRLGDGVAHVLEIFREEISRTLTLMGLSDIAELYRSHVLRRP